MGVSRRAVSPVIGVVMMVSLTLLLASVVAATVTSYDGGLDGKERQFEETVDDAGTATLTATATTLAGSPWTGSRGDLIQPSNDDAGAVDVSYRVNFSIESGSNTIGNSLNSIELKVTNGSSPDMFSNVDLTDLDKVAVDENSDGTVDQVITGDVTGAVPSVDGTQLTIDFTGSAYTAQANDSIIAVFGDADNPPSAGVYAIEAQTSGDGNWHNGTITID